MTANSVSFPPRIVPDPDPAITCVHNNHSSSQPYDLYGLDEPDGEHFIKLSENIKVFAEKQEMIGDTGKVCKCYQQADCDKFKLWNMAASRMLSYGLLLDYLHLYSRDGTAMNAFFESRSDKFTSVGWKSELRYDIFQRAVCGFFHQLKFPENTFICPNCKTNPKYLVFDGKCMGPRA